MTNGDKIRQMGDEGLAELMNDVLGNVCMYGIYHDLCDNYKSCRDCWLDWLAEEADEADEKQGDGR